MLDNDGGGAHTENGPVPATIERERGFLDGFIGCGRTHGKKARTDPLEQLVARYIVARDDNDPFAAPGADPVIGDGDGLCCAGARCVYLGVWAARTDVLGKLGMAERHNPVEELPIERVVRCSQFLLQVADAMPNLGGDPGTGAKLLGLLRQVLQLREAGLGYLHIAVAVHLLHETVGPGEGRSEYDAGRVSVGVGQHVAIRQPGAGRGVLVMHHQRDSGVAQRLDSGADRKRARPVERPNAFLRESKLGGEIERPAATRQLDYIVVVVDRLETTPTGFGLDEPRDVLPGDALPLVRRQRLDELLAA